MIENILIGKIVNLPKNKKSIIAITGAADLGKSYISNRIVRKLRKLEIDSHHLNLDSFLMERAERIKNGLSGYQKETHDIHEISKSLESWRNNRIIKFKPYDHETGRKSKYYQEIQPSKILIIEGLFAMHTKLIHQIDLSIFIYTSDNYLKKIKHEADIIKRKYTVEYSNQIYDYEFELYKKNIEPFKEKADINLYLEKKWLYKIK